MIKSIRFGVTGAGGLPLPRLETRNNLRRLRLVGLLSPLPDALFESIIQMESLKDLELEALVLTRRYSIANGPRRCAI